MRIIAHVSEKYKSTQPEVVELQFWSQPNYHGSKVIFISEPGFIRPVDLTDPSNNEKKTFNGI